MTSPLLLQRRYFSRTAEPFCSLLRGEAAFTKRLGPAVSRANLPQLDASRVLDAGATQIRTVFSGQELEVILGSYLEGCKTSHIIAVACGAIAGLISFSNAGPAAVKWVQIRRTKTHAG